MHKMEFSASLICGDLWDIRSQLLRLQATGIRHLHIDIMDGVYVPNLTFGPWILRMLGGHKRFSIALHFLVKEPFQIMKLFELNQRNEVILPVDIPGGLAENLQVFEKQGCSTGVFIHKVEDLKLLFPIMPELSCVAIMTSKVGLSGYPFDRKSLDVIAAVADFRRLSGGKFIIEADGHVTVDIIPTLARLGVDRVVLGGAGLFDQPGGERRAIKKIRRALMEMI